VPRMGTVASTTRASGVIDADFRPPRPASRCSSLFFRKLLASEASCSAGILRHGRSGKRNNSKTPAVPPLFLAKEQRNKPDLTSA
jgi:hypothetical protein